jgi:hypothetical protein
MRASASLRGTWMASWRLRVFEWPVLVGTDERFQLAPLPRRTSAMAATSRSRRLSRRGASRVVAFVSAGAPAAL